MNEWMIRWMNKWLDEWMNDYMNEWMNDYMNEWLNDWMIMARWDQLFFVRFQFQRDRQPWPLTHVQERTWQRKPNAKKSSEFDPFSEAWKIFPAGRGCLSCAAFMELQTRLALLGTEANAFRSSLVSAKRPCRDPMKLPIQKEKKKKIREE